MSKVQDLERSKLILGMNLMNIFFKDLTTFQRDLYTVECLRKIPTLHSSLDEVTTHGHLMTHPALMLYRLSYQLRDFQEGNNMHENIQQSQVHYG